MVKNVWLVDEKLACEAPPQLTGDENQKRLFCAVLAFVGVMCDVPIQDGIIAGKCFWDQLFAEENLALKRLAQIGAAFMCADFKD